MSGTLRVGTSGFAYPAWAPRVLPAGPARRGPPARLRRAAQCVRAEQHLLPSADARGRSGWLARTPGSFRFAVKAQRGGTMRALLGDDQAESVGWLTRPLDGFGERLGSVLYRVPGEVAGPTNDMPGWLACSTCGRPVPADRGVPARDPGTSTRRSLAQDARRRPVRDGPRRAGGPTLRPGDWAVPLPPPPPDDLQRRGPGRLGRTGISPFLDAGLDAYAFFRHDETGISPGAERWRSARASSAGQPLRSPPASPRPGRTRRGSRAAR